MKHIHIINGPNLNLLGKRQPEIYGAQTFENYFASLHQRFDQAQLSYFQSNHEGEILDYLHLHGFQCDGIVLNGGAFTHTSIAIADAIAAIPAPVVEVHISNIHARASFRQHSYFSAYCKGCIFGLALKGYELAIHYLLSE